MMSPANVFRWCIATAISLIVLITLTFNSVAPGALGSVLTRGALLLSAGVLPIVAYYIRMRSEISARPFLLSESSIDSVYYLGFLITLVTLLCTVISYGISAADSQQQNQSSSLLVSVSFGLSLAATAIALWARVDLMQYLDDKRAALRDATSDDAMHQSMVDLQERYRDLSQVMTRASSQFEATMTQNALLASKDLQEVVEAAKSSMHKFLQDAAKEITGSDLSGAVKEAATSFKKGSTVVANLFKNLEALELKSEAAVTTLEEMDAQISDAKSSTTAVGGLISNMSLKAASIDFESIKANITALRLQFDELANASLSAKSAYVDTSKQSVAAMESQTRQLESAVTMLSTAFVLLSKELASSATLMSTNNHDK